ncbi:hypothetical protein V1525DRAFT_252258 [Lipomyces kononenkoae]|uniref:Uncharacterized protein n=1 Tax=Lipomyces kononenkoae TaxID=34357 RepID=A0ACC3SVR7_LIPKO
MNTSMKALAYFILILCGVATVGAYDIIYYADNECQEPLDLACIAVPPAECCTVNVADSVFFNCNPDDIWWVYYGGGCANDYGGDEGPICFDSESWGVTGAKYATSPYKLRARDAGAENATIPEASERKKLKKTAADLKFRSAHS